MEVPGIEPGTSYMRSTRSTTELHPPVLLVFWLFHKNIFSLSLSLSLSLFFKAISCLEKVYQV